MVRLQLRAAAISPVAEGLAGIDRTARTKSDGMGYPVDCPLSFVARGRARQVFRTPTRDGGDTCRWQEAVWQLPLAFTGREGVVHLESVRALSKRRPLEPARPRAGERDCDDPALKQKRRPKWPPFRND